MDRQRDSTHQGGPETPTTSAANAINSSFQALKSNSSKLATFIRNKTVVAADVVVQSGQQAATKLGTKSWSTEPPTALKQLRSSAAGTLAKAAEGTQWIYHTGVKTAVKTAEELRKLSWFGESLQSLCKSEARLYPVPRVLSACCYTLAAGGLEAEGIFKVESEAGAVDFCATQFDQGMALFPPGTSAHTVAALLKKFLASLPEPILTYKLLPSWLSAVDDVDLIRSLLAQLPLANRNSLALLMVTCHRIAQQAAINEMDAQALAEVLAPLLLWRQPAPVNGQITSQVSSASTTTANLPHSIAAPFPADDSATSMDRPTDLQSTPGKPAAPPAAAAEKVLLDGFELQSAERLVETMISNSLSLF